MTTRTLTMMLALALLASAGAPTVAAEHDTVHEDDDDECCPPEPCDPFSDVYHEACEQVMWGFDETWSGINKAIDCILHPSTCGSAGPLGVATESSLTDVSR